MTEFSEYYKRELRLLRERAAEFAQDHPSLAGLLEGASADPDVERLLEGVAFLAADIRRTVDGDFDEVVHDLAQTICPHHLQPIPSATVIAFEPKTNLKQTQTVAAGTQLESVPVDGAPCYFRTTLDTPVSPLVLESVRRPDQETDAIDGDGLVRINLRLSSGDTALNTLRLPRLRLYLAGEFSEAADLYMLLTHYLQGVRIVDSGTGEVIDLPPTAVAPVGFEPGESLLPRPGNVLPVFGMLQDYFLFAEKFLFLEIDLERWRERSSGGDFEVQFQCSQPPFPVPSVTRERFVLHATPAINAFDWESDPVVMDQRQTEYPVYPAGSGGNGLTVHSVQGVEGIARGGTGRRAYQPFSAFLSGERDTPVYNVHYRREESTDRYSVNVSVALPDSEPLRHREVLKAWLTCTNGEHAEALLPHDIQTPTRDTPELVSFTNLVAPTPARQPPMDRTRLWHLISHLSLNYLSVADLDNLKSLLKHYAVPGAGERARDLPNLKRIDSIREIRVSPDERLMGDCFVRGQQIVIRLRSDHFTGAGDRYLFGCVLNRFFSGASAVNTYIALKFEDSATGERIEWPATLGARALL